MKKYLRIILSMLIVLAMAVTIVACKPTPTPVPGGDETPGTGDTPETPDLPKEPAVVLEALNIDNGQHIAALEAVYNYGIDLINRAVAVYDISLEKEGVKVQPNGKILVSVPVLIAEILEYDVYHILADGSVESIVSTVVDGMITFETESFSDFVFVSNEKYNINDYNITSTSTVQVFQTITIEKYELILGLLGIDSLDDVTVYLNGEEYTDIISEEGNFYISTNKFYNGECITISVVPNNGYVFGSYALYKFVSGGVDFTYYTDSEISVTLNDKWAGVIACELFAPNADRKERTFDITASSKNISLENLTFTINGVEMNGENYVRDDGGSSYKLIHTVKNGDIITISANLPAKCRFTSFILRNANGAIIEEVTTNSITFKIESDTASLDLCIEDLDYLGMSLDGRSVGWSSIRGNMHTGIRYLTVIKGSCDTSPADVDVWIYTDYQEYLLTPDQYTVDLGDFDINTPGVYQIKYTFIEDPDFFIYFNITVAEEDTVSCDFSTVPDGEQYANESVSFGNVTVSTHNNGCYFAGQLRIYDNDTNNGYAVIKAPHYITALTLVAGNNNATLEVYGSHDGEEWFRIEDVSVVKDYATYTVTIDPNKTYTYLKLDAEGAQIRIKSLSVSHVEAEPPYVVTVYSETDIDFSFMGSVSVSVDDGEFTEYDNYHQLLFEEPQHTVTFKQQAKEGYVFLGWYIRYKDENGKDTTMLIGTDDQYTMNIAREAQIEAHYESIG